MKHVYGRERKHQLKPLEDFDPCPVELRGKVNDHLETFLAKVRGEGLGVSLLLDKESRCWSSDVSLPLTPVLPTTEELRKRVEDFKTSLHLPSYKIREIEQSTRDQAQNPLWYSVRRYRLTAFYFGAIHRRQPTTPPKALVICAKPFYSEATSWGKKNEAVALEKYK